MFFQSNYCYGFEIFGWRIKGRRGVSVRIVRISGETHCDTPRKGTVNEPWQRVTTWGENTPVYYVYRMYLHLQCGFPRTHGGQLVCVCHLTHCSNAFGRVCTSLYIGRVSLEDGTRGTFTLCCNSVVNSPSPIAGAFACARF